MEKEVPLWGRICQTQQRRCFYPSRIIVPNGNTFATMYDKPNSVRNRNVYPHLFGDDISCLKRKISMRIFCEKTRIFCEKTRIFPPPKVLINLPSLLHHRPLPLCLSAFRGEGNYSFCFHQSYLLSPPSPLLDLQFIVQ